MEKDNSDNLDETLKNISEFLEFEKTIKTVINGQEVLVFNADTYKKWKELNEKI